MAELHRATRARIEPRHLGRVWLDPFFSLKPVGEGTGLGLSIAFGIVALPHARGGGQPGQGACFTVRLPLAERGQVRMFQEPTNDNGKASPEEQPQALRRPASPTARPTRETAPRTGGGR